MIQTVRSNCRCGILHSALCILHFYEIRDHHSRRRGRRAARVARRQNAAAGGPYAGDGCRSSRSGVVGRANNVPPSLPAGSDVANLSLLGYDPLEHFTGRAPLEAAAQGIELGPDDWAIRCNLVTVENQTMRDFTAGHISTEEASELLATAQEHTRQRAAAILSRRQLSQSAGLSRRETRRPRSRQTPAPRRRTI